MIRLGLRLSLGGGREALIRHLVIASGVAIDIALLLFMISGLRILGGSWQQPCWRCTGQSIPSKQGNSTANPLRWHRLETIFHGKSIERYDIAQTGPNAPQIPGIMRLPGPGEYYASPALAKLLHETPANQLKDRFPGTLVGQIGRAGLDGPKDLIAVVGRIPAELPLTPVSPGETLPLGTNDFTYNVWKVNDKPEKRDFGSFIMALFGVGVVGLLISVITLITTATRLSAARREEKFAALRLFGATPLQINGFAAIDAALGASVGALLGLGLFYLLRPALVSGLSFTETVSFFPEDLTPGLLGTIGVLFGTPLLAAGVAILSLRRVRLSPLGVARKTTPKPPRWWGLLPLGSGLAGLLTIWFVNRNVLDSFTKGKMIPYFLVAGGLLLFGMIVTGPWLTMVATRLVARRARSGASLLAFRRLADNPGAAFRAVNTLVIAAFLCTFFAALTPIMLHNTSDSPSGLGQRPTIIDLYFSSSESSGRQHALLSSLAEMATIPGVHPILAYSSEKNEPQGSAESILIPCSEVAYLDEKPCAPNNTAISVSIGYGGSFGQPVTPFVPKQVAIPVAELQQHSLAKLLVVVSGGQQNVERVRTLLAQRDLFIADGFFTITVQELEQREHQVITNIRYLVNGAFLLVIFVACCSLAVSVGGGLVERKRPFGLLRVAGASLRQLRGVVLIESAVPLLAAVVVSSALGFGVAVLLVKSFADNTIPAVQALPIDYYIAMACGTGMALAVLLTTLPLLAAITKPENARFE